VIARVATGRCGGLTEASARLAVTHLERASCDVPPPFDPRCLDHLVALRSVAEA